jgi:hypothetical protein
VSRQLQRDPFGRRTLMRRDADMGTPWVIAGCDWCGQSPLKLFVYWWEDDSRPQQPTSAAHRFCSIDCARSYGVI